MHPFGPETEHRLVETFRAVREAIVDALIWFSDMCLALFDWLAQGQVSLPLLTLLAQHHLLHV